MKLFEMLYADSKDSDLHAQLRNIIVGWRTSITRRDYRVDDLKDQLIDIGRLIKKIDYGGTLSYEDEKQLRNDILAELHKVYSSPHLSYKTLWQFAKKLHEFLCDIMVDDDAE